MAFVEIVGFQMEEVVGMSIRGRPVTLHQNVDNIQQLR